MAYKEYNGRVWPGLLDFNIQMDRELTSKGNFLFGASTLIFFSTLSRGLEAQALSSLARIGWYTLLTGAFSAMVCGLMMILPKPPFLQHKKRIKEDVFYYKNIMRFYTRKAFVEHITRMPRDDSLTAKAYAHQIYTLTTHIIPYKSRLLKFGGWILLTAILLGAGMILYA